MFTNMAMVTHQPFFLKPVHVWKLNFWVDFASFLENVTSVAYIY